MRACARACLCACVCRVRAFVCTHTHEWVGVCVCECACVRACVCAGRLESLRCIINSLTASIIPVRAGAAGVCVCAFECVSARAQGGAQARIPNLAMAWFAART